LNGILPTSLSHSSEHLIGKEICSAGCHQYLLEEKDCTLLICISDRSTVAYRSQEEYPGIEKSRAATQRHKRNTGINGL